MQVVQLTNSSGERICADIYCQKKLSGFDLSKNQRFCKGCRVSPKILLWRCLGCKSILTNSQFRETKMFCDGCNGKTDHQA
jgi:hypothetical protein